MRLDCFKAYDIRGRLGRDLTPEIAARIARALAGHLAARRVVIGRDPRPSSPDLAQAAVAALVRAGVQVIDLGLCGTEEVYFATDHTGADAGICITASHNPITDNGMKLVGRGAAPLADLAPIRALAEAGEGVPDAPGGSCTAAPDLRGAYVARVLSFVDAQRLPPLKVVVNCGNGAAGPALAALGDALAGAGSPLMLLPMFDTPDPTFPNGIPNPLLPENQPVTGQAVIAQGADFGVALDGDFDRCFLFDHLGRFVPGEQVVALLAQAMLARHPGATIIHDPRALYATTTAVAAAGGRAVAAPTGHAYLKAAMRRENAVYGGELSAHHYFRDFMFCDSGMIPWLLVAALIGHSGRSLADLVQASRSAFPSSGEINFRHSDPAAARDRIIAHFAAEKPARDDLDGLSLDFGHWRLNLRNSNTEALLRLNVESRGDADLVAKKAAMIAALLTG
ncbi:phosphomannomutase [Paracoccus sp. p3-h83]|uniref:phosphomannomutase n=1 Tax=Paracoccus sp. p3-h83 TaxID=3342805 RepID=UPI0035B8AF77